MEKIFETHATEMQSHRRENSRTTKSTSSKQMTPNDTIDSSEMATLNEVI